MLLDPDNVNMRYNFACTLVLDLHEHDAALDLLEPLFEKNANRGDALGEDRPGPRRHPRPSALRDDDGGGRRRGWPSRTQNSQGGLP